MATLAQLTAPPRIRAAGRTRFYFWLSLVCLAIGVGGFAPTYWLQVPAGTFKGNPLTHVHSAVFTGWLLLLVGQNWRIAQGRLDHHRAWGLVGISLATLAMAIGIVTAIVALKTRLADGYGDDARAFLIVPMFAVTVFYGFVVAAMANIRRPEWHKRFIFVATATALAPAVARTLLLLRRGYEPGLRPAKFPPAPVDATFSFLLIASLVVVAGMVFDWRTRRRMHPAWIIGLAVMLGGGLLRAPLAATPAWLAFADWTTRIAG